MNSKNSFFLLILHLKKREVFYSKMDSPVKHRDFFSKPFLSNWELDLGLEIRSSFLEKKMFLLSGNIQNAYQQIMLLKKYAFIPSLCSA